MATTPTKAFAVATSVVGASGAAQQRFSRAPFAKAVDTAYTVVSSQHVDVNQNIAWDADATARQARRLRPARRPWPPIRTSLTPRQGLQEASMRKLARILHTCKGITHGCELGCS